jgi:hypothetical protein
MSKGQRCFRFEASRAKQHTGFDPMAQSTATGPPPAQEGKQGGVVKGAATVSDDQIGFVIFGASTKF